MSTGTILDADMTTIARWIRTGWQWWIEELSALVPERLYRRRGDGSGSALFDPGSGEIRDLEARGDGGPASHSRASLILLPSVAVLRRSIELPLMGQADLRRLIALDADRLMPMPIGEAILATSISARDPDTKRMTVQVAALPRPIAERLGQAITASPTPIRRVAIEAKAGDWLIGFDFLPVLREAGLIGTARSTAAGWWMIAGFLVLLNIGFVIWRDVASLQRLSDAVDAQQPAVTIAQRISRGSQRAIRLARASAIRREQQDALAMLGLTSALIPEGAWVQRYGWDGTSLHLAGYKPRDLNLLDALRQSPAIADVRDAQADGLADIPAGQPFDVVATLRKPSR